MKNRSFKYRLLNYVKNQIIECLFWRQNISSLQCPLAFNQTSSIRFLSWRAFIQTTSTFQFKGNIRLSTHVYKQKNSIIPRPRSPNQTMGTKPKSIARTTRSGAAIIKQCTHSGVHSTSNTSHIGHTSHSGHPVNSHYQRWLWQRWVLTGDWYFPATKAGDGSPEPTPWQPDNAAASTTKGHSSAPRATPWRP